MPSIKETIKANIIKSIKTQMNAGKIAKPQKTFGGFLSNTARELSDVVSGLATIGYKAVTHPVKTTRVVGSVGKEVVKLLPGASMGLASSIGKIVSNPLGESKKLIDSYGDLRNISYEDQRKVWDSVIQNSIKEKELGKKWLGILGGGMLTTTLTEATHPIEYAYQNPITFALDAATLGGGLSKVTGLSKATAPIRSSLNTAIKELPPVMKVRSALKEVFVPMGKLRDAGFESAAKKIMDYKTKMFKVQKDVIEDTAYKFTKVFGLSKKEQSEFFNTIDSLRRSGKVATSNSPRIEKAIRWWLDEEAPALAKKSGLPESNTVSNYLHHFFPEKFAPQQVSTGKPLQYSKRGYLKKSTDVEGYTKDPILSISALKSKVEVDNLRDGLIGELVAEYAKPIGQLKDELVTRIGKEGVDTLEQTGKLTDYLKRAFNLDEYKPAGNLRFFKIEGGPVGVTKKVESYLMPRAIVDEITKFTKPSGSVVDKLLLPFDVFNRNWKPLATVVRARYHTRNIVGNLYNAIVLGGATPADFAVATYAQVRNAMASEIDKGTILGSFYKKVFGEIPHPKLIKTAADNSLIGRGFFGADLNDLSNAYLHGDDIMKTINSMNSPAEIYKVPGLKNVLTTSQKIGEFIEDNAKLALFNRAMKKFKGDVGKSKEFTNKHLFDYISGLGEGDKIIKRIIPFWSWTRFNIPLQAESLFLQPLSQSARMKLQKSVANYFQEQDKGYEFLTDEQKTSGFIKVGEIKTGNKILDRYIKTSSVIPQHDLVKIVNILRGKTDDIGFTPLFNLYKYITGDPTKTKDYFGQPLERFEGERKEFLGMAVRGRTKAIMSQLPFLTELDKMINTKNLDFDKTTEGNIKRVFESLRQGLSPFGESLQNPENNRFFRELEDERRVSGSYTGGLKSVYKKYLKQDLLKPENHSLNIKNIDILNTLLLNEGLTEIDLLKIKGAAIREALKESIMEKLKTTSPSGQ